jgi:hypothetical protein
MLALCSEEKKKRDHFSPEICMIFTTCLEGPVLHAMSATGKLFYLGKKRRQGKLASLVDMPCTCPQTTSESSEPSASARRQVKCYNIG